MTEGSLLTRTRRLLRNYGISTIKRLGQHFLIDDNVLNRILDYADIESNDDVLEIGAGIGTLTKALAKRARQVFTIEKDTRLCRALREEFGADSRITIIEGDAVKVEWPRCNKLVANLPYTISSPVIFKFLSTQFPFAVLMVQQEFAQRLAAKVNTKEYGRLTVMADYAATIDFLEKVDPMCFYPPPAVTSAIVRIKRRTSPPYKIEDFPLYTHLITALFNQRRKKIRTPLKSFLQGLELKPSCIGAIQEQIPWLDHRVEQLSPRQLADISNTIHEERMG
ncbi:MAG: 16S rRNA (adenine(1518)-N(6)/adenine(1519)-N(6))-dimethyltransferase RsmA [Promethearchaeota archaeon]